MLGLYRRLGLICGGPRAGSGWTGTHKAVNFPGLGTNLQRGSNFAGVADSTQFTLALKYRLPIGVDAAKFFEFFPGAQASTPILRLTAGIGDSPLFSVGNSTFSYSGFALLNDGVSLAIGAWHTLHIHVSSAYGGNGEIRHFVDGVAKTPIALTGTPVVFDWTHVGTTGMRIDAGGNMNVDLAFLYLSLAVADGTASHFYNGGDVDLGLDGTLSGAPAPICFFGGRQAADAREGDGTKGWNDGFNQGTGGDFVMTGGTVTNV